MNASPTKHPIKSAAVLGALGIVFGDIGTSPLYAFKESFRVAMNGGINVNDAVLGVLSLIFWVLTITISIKYLIFILRADNDGEGGVMALITGLRLHREKKKFYPILLTAGLLGAAMLFGDGVITPAISVLSAIEGVQVVAPGLDQWVLHITFIILIGIFLSQRFGTEKIGKLYGPIMLIWFVTMGTLGVNAIMDTPQVLAALNPGYALVLLANHPELACALIGGTFLAVTGGEALFADMGHFGRGVLRVGWYTVVMPGLVLNYFGQGALTIANGGAVENPFYQLAPEWFGMPLLVLATLATIVASQAMITGAFAIARQTVEIGYFPPMRMKATSDKNALHIFIPRLNIALMCVCLAVVVLFPSSSALAGAYGVAVSVAMLGTTILFSIWMMQKARWPKYVVYPLTFIFIVLDTIFVATNLTKTFDGGWLPIVMGAFVLTCMISWHRGLEKLIERHIEYTEPMEDFAARIAKAPLASSRHTGIFFSRTGIMTPVPLERITNMLHVRFEKMVVISIKIASRPRLTPSERLSTSVIEGGIVKIEVRYGYQQTINIPATIGPVLAQHGIDADEAIYIIGHERVIAPVEPDCIQDLMNILFAFLAVTAERAVDRFRLPPSRTLEIGYPVNLQKD